MYNFICFPMIPKLFSKTRLVETIISGTGPYQVGTTAADRKAKLNDFKLILLCIFCPR